MEGTKQDFLTVSPSVSQDNFFWNLWEFEVFRNYLINRKIASTRGTSSLSHLINSFKVHAIYILISNPEKFLRFIRQRQRGCLCESSYHPLLIKRPETKVSMKYIKSIKYKKLSKKTENKLLFEILVFTCRYQNQKVG